MDEINNNSGAEFSCDPVGDSNNVEAVPVPGVSIKEEVEEKDAGDNQIDVYRIFFKRQSEALGCAIDAINNAVNSLNDRSTNDAIVKEKDDQIQFLTADLANKLNAHNSLLREVVHQRWLLTNMIPDYQYIS